jgi:hypothetical protein
MRAWSFDDRIAHPPAATASGDDEAHPPTGRRAHRSMGQRHVRCVRPTANVARKAECGFGHAVGSAGLVDGEFAQRPKGEPASKSDGAVAITMVDGVVDPPRGLADLVERARETSTLHSGPTRIGMTVGDARHLGNEGRVERCGRWRRHVMRKRRGRRGRSRAKLGRSRRRYESAPCACLVRRRLSSHVKYRQQPPYHGRAEHLPKLTTSEQRTRNHYSENRQETW